MVVQECESDDIASNSEDEKLWRTHTEVLNLISSGKFNDSRLLSYINWLNWFFLNLQKLDLVKLSFSFPDIPIFTIYTVFSGLTKTSVRFQRKPCPADYLS